MSKKGKWEDWQRQSMQLEKGLLIVRIKYHSYHFIKVKKKSTKFIQMITITLINHLLCQSTWLHNRHKNRQYCRKI